MQIDQLIARIQQLGQNRKKSEVWLFDWADRLDDIDRKILIAHSYAIRFADAGQYGAAHTMHAFCAEMAAIKTALEAQWDRELDEKLDAFAKGEEA